MNEIRSLRSVLVWIVPFAIVLAILGWETDWGDGVSIPIPVTPPTSPQPVSVALMPEYRIDGALAAMDRRDGRRFYLANTAANLAGAEVQELVKSAIEDNGGRITTSQNTAPRDEGRFREIGVNVQFFATTPNLQKILMAIETHLPYLIVENLTVRPLNAFRGFKPAPGQEPELNVQLDVGGWAYPEPVKPGATPAKAL